MIGYEIEFVVPTNYLLRWKLVSFGERKNDMHHCVVWTCISRPKLDFVGDVEYRYDNPKFRKQKVGPIFLYGKSHIHSGRLPGVPWLVPVNST